MAKFTKVIAAGLIVLAVLLGLYAWVIGRRPAPQPVASPVAAALYPVVVAAKALQVGQPITADELRVQQMQSMPSSSFSDAALVVGRVPIGTVGENTPVLEGQLASGLASKLAMGERAFAVKVDETSGVGNRVHPGDYVDVFFLLHRDSTGTGESEIERTQARLLLSRVRVLAYGAATLAGADLSAAANQNQLGRMNNVRTAVLAVTTAQVDELALADSSGRVVLALRNPKDTEAADDKTYPAFGSVLTPAIGKSGTALSESDQAAGGLALNSLAGAGDRKKPVAARPADIPRRPAAVRSHSIEVIRGGQREAVAY